MIKNNIILFTAFLCFISPAYATYDFIQNEIAVSKAMYSNQWYKSITLLSQMLINQPQNAVYYESRGYSYAQYCLQTKDISYCRKALDDCNKSLSLGYKSATLYFTRATAYIKLKQLDNGMTDLTQALNYTYGDKNLEAAIYYVRGKLKIIYNDKYDANSGYLDIAKAKKISPSIVSNFDAQLNF